MGQGGVVGGNGDKCTCTAIRKLKITKTKSSEMDSLREAAGHGWEVSTVQARKVVQPVPQQAECTNELCSH